MRKSEELLAIGEVARRTGASVSAVRYYESLGLLPAQRTSGNNRVFPRHTIRRVSVIQASVRFGLSLTQIAELLGPLPADRPPTKRDWRKISMRWNAHLEERKQAITRLQKELTGCLGCGCLSLTACTLLNPADALGEQGPGPRRL